jgi:hypothetical protein
MNQRINCAGEQRVTSVFLPERPTSNGTPKPMRRALKNAWTNNTHTILATMQTSVLAPTSKQPQPVARLLPGDHPTTRLLTKLGIEFIPNSKTSTIVTNSFCL